MDHDTINNIVNGYIRDNLSPKPEQRAYIAEKYVELKGFLDGVCFRSGSYPRYTSIDPVHDLDVIYPVTDVTVRDDPTILIHQLWKQLEDRYKNSSTQVKRVYAQTHSVTVELADSPEGDFSIDIVPAIELKEKNEYSQALYSVPEILRLNRRNRQQRYDKASERPIGWIKSDPRGYIKASSDLNEANSDFRHAAKLVKGWRHACKMAYKDDFKLKSFHLEQIVSMFFKANPNFSTIEAVVACLKALPDHLSSAQIPDRADSTRLIDGYVDSLTDAERTLIIRLQADALLIAQQLPACVNKEDVFDNLKTLTTVTKPRQFVASPIARNITPRQPWAY
jgi:hypothetical protein